jgi:hypothetical protein
MFPLHSLWFSSVPSRLREVYQRHLLPSNCKLNIVMQAQALTTFSALASTAAFSQPFINDIFEKKNGSDVTD